MKKCYLILLSLLIIGCSSRKKVLYYQDIDDKVFAPLPDIYSHQKIQVNDILQINITSPNPESVALFSFEGVLGADNPQTQRRIGAPQLLKISGYLVDENGYIDLPKVGKIKLKGLTTVEAQDLIKEFLEKEVKDPNIKITLLNYKFTVEGEVNRPSTFDIIEENITLPQALGMAGGLTIKGKRDNILLIRHDGDNRIVKRIDLTKTDWMDTPFYYVKQNDIIYVEPNLPRVKSAGFIGNIGGVISIISGVLSIALTIIVLTN